MDLRTSPRYAMNGQVFRVDEIGRSYQLGKVRDISLGGCFVETNNSEHPLNEKLRLRFAIGADFQMEGTVTRVEEKGIAVEFMQTQGAEA